MTVDVPTLAGDAVALRPAAVADVARFAEILATPEVACWWHGYDEARIRREMFEADDADATANLAIELGGTVIGLIMFTEENEPDYRHASIDVSLDPAFHHRGLGADSLRTLARHLFERRGHHRLTIDPAAHNEVAIRCYTSVGFRPVGLMRNYERGPDGTWHDGLLMDLLDHELT